jgi:phosphate transport system protein
MFPPYENKIEMIRTTIMRSLDEIKNASSLSLEAFQNKDETKFNVVKDQLLQLQSHANSIDNEIIKTFALFGPEAQELRTLVSYLKMNNEIVRIGEGVKKYARRMQEHCQGESDFEGLSATIVLLHKSTINAIEHIVRCFEMHENCDMEDMYRKVMVEESQNDDLFSILEKDILKQITKGEELSLEYVKVLGTLRKLERCCDRTVNVAKLMLYAQRGGEMKIYED